MAEGGRALCGLQAGADCRELAFFWVSNGCRGLDLRCLSAWAMLDHFDSGFRLQAIERVCGATIVASMQVLGARPALLPGSGLSAQRQPSRSRRAVTRAQASPDDAPAPAPWRGALLGALAATSLVREPVPARRGAPHWRIALVAAPRNA